VIGETRLPVGEEVVSPYWVPGGAGPTVQLIPMARYSHRVKLTEGYTGWNAMGSTTNNQLYGFIGGTDPQGGENQKVMPATIAGRPNSFTPGGPFGLWMTDKLDKPAQFSYSDDGRNTATRVHDLRFYPAKGATGTQVPDTWIVIYDVGNTLPKVTQGGWD